MRAYLKEKRIEYANVCAALKQNVSLFLYPTQASVGLQNGMKAGTPKGSFVLIPHLGRRTVPCQCLLIPRTHLAYYTSLYPIPQHLPNVLHWSSLVQLVL